LSSDFTLQLKVTISSHKNATLSDLLPTDVTDQPLNKELTVIDFD